MKTPELETERLILRPIAISDAPAIQKYFNNWDIIQHLSKSVPWPYPDDGAESFIREQCAKPDDQHYMWVITEKDGNGEAIGCIDFRTKTHNDGNRGFWLAVPFQGRGYMTEAVHAVNNFIFNTLQIDEYVVSNVATNARSRRVKEKTGAIFLHYGTLDHHTGGNKTEYWKITRESWVQSKKI